jgi:predicted RNase H-like nuclease (RuvC/YqgF family)
MNIRNHFKERYVQRINGLTDKQEIKQYIAVNDAQITENINKMFEHAKFLYRGQVGKNNATCNFYIADNLILVADNHINLMTLYRVDFNFPEEINRQVAKGLLEEIDRLQEMLQEANKDIDEYINQKTIEIENTDTEIKSLERQLEIKKMQKKILEDDVKGKRGDVDYLNQEITKYANMLCNSLEYKKAMSEVVAE